MSKRDKFDSRALLNKVRKHTNLKENNESQAGVSTLSEVELEDEMNRFKEAVGSTAEFNEFKIYDGTNNIEWSGLLPVENLAWSFSLENNNGCYITVNALQLNNESLERINKLSAYYNVWLDYWMKEVNG